MRITVWWLYMYVFTNGIVAKLYVCPLHTRKANGEILPLLPTVRSTLSFSRTYMLITVWCLPSQSMLYTLLNLNSKHA